VLDLGPSSGAEAPDRLTADVGDGAADPPSDSDDGESEERDDDEEAGDETAASLSLSVSGSVLSGSAAPAWR
jgi:hypothetical protein